MQIDLAQHAGYWLGRLPPGAGQNTRLIAAFEREEHRPQKQTHFFGGRYENIYFDESQLPELDPLMRALTLAAQTILGCPARDLACDCWFNKMAPGDLTGLHSHDDDDELLSAVYYLKTPLGSGQLVLHTPSGRQEITPRAGDAIFFHPAIPHEVEENRSRETRFSLALNFGPGHN